MFWKDDRSKLRIAASLLSADFAHLADEIKHVTDAGIEQIHIEVCDGVFAPSITVGAPVIKSLRNVTEAVLEAHVMAIQPERKIEELAKAGADLITFHIEATDHAQSVIHQIKGAGSKAGIALNPATPLGTIEEILYDVDVVLLMTAIPGAAGQPLLKHSLDKVKRLHNIIRENNYDCWLEVDGGVTIDNAAALREAGANILVSGTAIYESTDVWASTALLKAGANILVSGTAIYESTDVWASTALLKGE